MKNWDRRSLLRLAGGSASALALGLGGRHIGAWAADAAPGPAVKFTDVPDNVWNPVEVSGAEAEPIVGRLPGAHRMYVLPTSAGEYHRVGGFALRRVARPIDTGDGYEILDFAGLTGATMPRHLHRQSHVALLVMGGDVELELDGKKWRMMRGDFANIPPGTPHGWTMRSDRGQITLFIMGDRAGAAFVAMGTPSPTSVALVGLEKTVSPDKMAAAAFAGDFMRVEQQVAGEAVRVTNLMLPQTPGPYVLLDGGGERFGGDTFCAKNPNTNGQFLFIMTEGTGRGVGAHFHARHTEGFYAVDGETLVWAYGKAVSLKPGDIVAAPPRNLHGFKLNAPYNRFVGFLTPGIFETFFTGGKAGVNGEGGHPNIGGTFRVNTPGAALNERYISRRMSAKGPDGYPLDTNPPKLPLPPQDPVWLNEAKTGFLDRKKVLTEHAMAICGESDQLSKEISPELAASLKLKPKAIDFV